MTTLALLLWLGVARDLAEPVASAIDGVTAVPEERVALVTDGWFESRYARYVLEGRCLDGPRGARCDPGKDGVPRARGAWQVWKFCKRTGMAGEARCVLDQMRLGRQRCASWEGAFSALHGPTCGWAGATRRVQMMRRLLGLSSPIPEPSPVP